MELDGSPRSHGRAAIGRLWDQCSDNACFGCLATLYLVLGMSSKATSMEEEEKAFSFLGAVDVDQITGHLTRYHDKLVIFRLLDRNRL